MRNYNKLFLRTIFKNSQLLQLNNQNRSTLENSSMSYTNLKLRIHQASTIKTNITSNINVSPSEQYFAAITRQLASNSSQFIYRLQLYDLVTQKKLVSKDVYSTYEQRRHYLEFLNDNRIFIATKYHILFYDTPNLKILHKQLHEQQNVYGMCVSPNGKYSAIVGDRSALFWESTKTAENVIIAQSIEHVQYAVVDFPYEVATARKCKFSKDGKYFGLSENTLISVYELSEAGGYLDFLNPRYTPEVLENGVVSSFDFNPHDSQEIVVGFSNVSPRLYNFSINGAEYQTVHGASQQPQYYDNYKEVSFLPDGKRVLSSDYKEGVGLWPGDSSRQLYYRENYLLFGLKPFYRGERAIGFVWQQLKVIKIQMKCTSTQSYTSQCSCQSNQYWDQGTYSCKNCPNGTCSCRNGFIFSVELGQCTIQCSKISNTAVNSPLSVTQCLCKNGYVWNNDNIGCIFDCRNIAYATNSTSNLQTCGCSEGFKWDNTLKACVCPKYANLIPSNIAFQLPPCSCATGTVFNQQRNQCVLDCQNMQYSTGRNTISANNQTQCECQANYVFGNQFQVSDGTKVFGCRYNCTLSQNTLVGFKNDARCQCVDSMDWDIGRSECIINCTRVVNGVSTIYDNDGKAVSCQCPFSYQWVHQNLQCGRQCTGVEYLNESRYSTSASCPCVNNFKWNDVNKVCKIDCEQIDYAVSYSIDNNHQCICRQIFYWNNGGFKCSINCTQIWDAEIQVGTGQCSCKNDKIFNKTQLLCQAQPQKSIFYQWWIWLLMAIGIVFVIIVAIIMIKFCWKFSTEKNNKEHNKKLKKNMDPPKKKKIPNEKKGGVSSERMKLNG